MTTKQQPKTGDPRTDRAQSEQQPPADSTPRRARRTRSAVAKQPATRRPGATEQAVQVKNEAPSTELVPATSTALTKRQPPKREGRPIADEKTRKSIAVRLMRAKESGWSRPQLAELAFGSADQHYPIWRFQESSRGGYAEHVDAIELALAKLETGEAKLPERTMRVAASGPSRAQLATDLQTVTNTIESVRSLLDAVLGRPKVTAAEKKLATSVLDALGQE